MNAELPPAIVWNYAPHDPGFASRAAAYTEEHEGRRSRLYWDSKGLLHIGIGHRVLPNEAHRYRGRRLSEQEMDRLFRTDLARKIRLAEQHLGEAFHTFDEPVRLAVVDGFFRGDLSGSPRALSLLRAGHFRAAADAYLDSDEYRKARRTGSGVASRMEKNARLIASGERSLFQLPAFYANNALVYFSAR